MTLATDSLWPALIAHVGVNLHGFSLGGRRPGPSAAPRSGSAASEGGPFSPGSRGCAGSRLVELHPEDAGDAVQADVRGE